MGGGAGRGWAGLGTSGEGGGYMPDTEIRINVITSRITMILDTVNCFDDPMNCSLQFQCAMD